VSHVFYLHGFASSPATAKGQALKRLLAADVTSYAVPRLDGGDFTAMTFASMRRVVADAVAALPADGAPVLLIGSSLGGFLAALVAAELPRVRGLCLIAPAFEFGPRWAERIGEAGVERWRADGRYPFFHFATERDEPLGYGFYQSCIGLPDHPTAPAIPVAIVHGLKDDTVDWRVSARYRDRTPTAELHLIDGDHRLTEPRHEALIAWCARDLIARTR
jgi:pimeloyl-ACP methyl ester carboxylesterase